MIGAQQQNAQQQNAAWLQKMPEWQREQLQRAEAVAMQERREHPVLFAQLDRIEGRMKIMSLSDILQHR